MIAATKDEARAAILRGVTRLLTRSGYRKMTMDDLAEEVGIGKGTLYLYFPSKEELVLSHIDGIVDSVCEALSAEAASSHVAEKKLRAMLVARVMVRFDAVFPYREKLGENVTDLRGLLLQRRKLHFEREAALLANVLLEGRKTGELEFQGAEQTAMLMIHGTNAMLPYSLRPEELENRNEIAQRVDGVARLLVAGVRGRTES